MFEVARGRGLPWLQADPSVVTMFKTMKFESPLVTIWLQIASIRDKEMKEWLRNALSRRLK